ncbi:Fe-S protein assembly co-chaperone HscB [Candidatus Persebacteraceae bacterium Df01]|jgi:molecular chaperone HscB|uniref:Co-chaperone protein HscB homolog n=1 Tax=Candidatus Doriopsillibacter californiensis TaxID=2970740 RepID=A0ABT7QMX8_9GAMM|nr:Fe-S protein assembly co-chaperone HscB [Candidatus Persebacteraceae bacterium Df01]
MISSDDFFSCDYFSLFALSQSITVDNKQLQERYQSLQRSVHPDRFAAAPTADKRAAMQMASRVNEAYQTLRTPLRCAAYLLSLRGISALAENNTVMPPDFLMQQLEWREALEEAENDTAALATLRKEIETTVTTVQYDTTTHLANNDNEAAANAVRRWHYLQKMLDDIA